jgi:RNA polymerase sigma factor (sigma-70 family)
MRQKWYGPTFSAVDVSTLPLSPTESRELEQEYRVHRPMVLGMLRDEFGGLPDHEELYQEAWTEVLELRARGTPIKNLSGLLRTVAWRRARDRLRNRSAEAIDPDSAVLSAVADSAPEPDEHAQVHLDAALLRGVIDTLEPRHAAVLKMRFDWQLDSREIQQRLGVSPKHRSLNEESLELAPGAPPSRRTRHLPVDRARKPGAF